jgi:hypothetical protein
VYSKEEIEKTIKEDYEFSVTASGNKLTVVTKQKKVLVTGKTS